VYSIKSWSPRETKQKVWYVAEDGIAIYEAVRKLDAERYLAFLLRHTRP
jgi:hypothetical protein